MIVNEIFYSLQGEGLLAGTPSVFIRLAGCPLRCRWCDTKYAWDFTAGEEMEIPKILEIVERFQCSHIVITGGEPMVCPDLLPLTGELKKVGKHITIETAGIAFVAGLKCDLMSISPKLSNSVPVDSKLAAILENSRFNLKALKNLISNYHYQLKFVVDSPSDLQEIKDIVNRIDNIDKGKVMLMPQAAGRKELLAKSGKVIEMCKETGFNFGPRLQILLWDTTRGI